MNCDYITDDPRNYLQASIFTPEQISNTWQIRLDLGSNYSNRVVNEPTRAKRTDFTMMGHCIDIYGFCKSCAGKEVNHSRV